MPYADPPEIRERIRKAADDWPLNTHHKPLHPKVRQAVNRYLETGNPGALKSTVFRAHRQALAAGRPMPSCCASCNEHEQRLERTTATFEEFTA